MQRDGARSPQHSAASRPVAWWTLLAWHKCRAAGCRSRCADERCVILLPCGKQLSSMIERREQGLVQELVTQPPIEAFHECILLRLSRCDIMPFNPGLLRPAQDGHTGELSSVVADNRKGPPAPGNRCIELTAYPGARE